MTKKRSTKRTVGALINSLDRQRQKIAAVEAELRALKDAAERTETDLLRALADSNLIGAVGGTKRARIVETIHYRIEDRAVFDQYVADTEAYELFQNRITKRALEDLLEEEGVDIADIGVTSYTSKKVSLTKR